MLVHGGGPAINEMLKKVGVESHFNNGLRVTDDATMEIVQQVLAGKVNKDLVAKLRGRGVGLCGMDGQMLRCTRTGPALGPCGEIIHVDPTLISTLLDETMGNYPYMYEHKVPTRPGLEVRFRQAVPHRGTDRCDHQSETEKGNAAGNDRPGDPGRRYRGG